MRTITTSTSTVQGRLSRRRVGTGLLAAAGAVGAGTALVASLAAAGSTPASAAQVDSARRDAATAAAPAKTMFAVVDGAGGGLFSSDSHVLTSQKLGSGLDGRKYRITFDRDIRQCAYLATPTATTPGDLVNAGTGIAVRQNPSFATRQVLDVITEDVDGAPVFHDSSFSLLVHC